MYTDIGDKERQDRKRRQRGGREMDIGQRDRKERTAAYCVRLVYFFFEIFLR